MLSSGSSMRTPPLVSTGPDPGLTHEPLFSLEEVAGPNSLILPAQYSDGGHPRQSCRAWPRSSVGRQGRAWRGNVTRARYQSEPKGVLNCFHPAPTLRPHHTANDAPWVLVLSTRAGFPTGDCPALYNRTRISREPRPRLGQVPIPRASGRP